MKTAPALLAASLLSTVASAQTLTRTYSVPFSEEESVVATADATANAATFGLALPDVDAGAFVEIVGVGFSYDGTQRIEADYTNSTGAPITVGSSVVQPDNFGVIGDPIGCAIGVDDCGFGCGAGGATVMVPPNSTITRVELDRTVRVDAFAGPGDFHWPCILDFDTLDAGVSAEIFGGPTSEVRATATMDGSTEVTAELTLNPNVLSVCPGRPNSLGLTATAEYFGSTEAGTLSAAVRVTDLPFDVATFCVITDAFSSSPLGVGPLPDLCLRGSRTFQRVQFASGTGETVFDITLLGFAPGETFSLQVGYRDSTPGGSNVSNMLLGVAE
ncbi:MAG: hypothetical protein AAFZ87_08720 [Planctomycetota bacterium]